jgi:hypothetical protein
MAGVVPPAQSRRSVGLRQTLVRHVRDEGDQLRRQTVEPLVVVPARDEQDEYNCEDHLHAEDHDRVVQSAIALGAEVEDHSGAPKDLPEGFVWE